jgi:hypothetical protein
MREHPSDQKVSELAIVILAHSVGVVLNGTNQPDRKVLQALDIQTIIRVVTENVRNPAASLYLFDHALSLLAGCTLYCAADCKAYPPMLSLLVASLRSKDIVKRSVAIGGLIRLHRLEAEDDPRLFDPMKLITRVQQGFPGHLTDIMLNYGPNRCETVLTLNTSSDFQKAMTTCVRNRDLRALGLTLSQLILRTEFSIADGMWQAENPTTGRLEMVDVGLPFQMWSDSLPHCAQAIRAHGDPKEEDAADILQLKYFVFKQRLREAVDHAKKAMERSPDVAYFYYIVTLTADPAEGLRFAKKGLKCKITTPFVRFQMMQRAVEHAADLGVIILQVGPTAGDRKWEEGVAFLMSAMEDAKTYIAEAPPDNRHMKNVSYWFIILTLTIRGPEMSTDLRELQVSTSRYLIVDLVVRLAE